LRLLILVAREGFLKDKCGPRAKKFEHHCNRVKPTSYSRWISSLSRKESMLWGMKKT